jgi:hypothetical protein
VPTVALLCTAFTQQRSVGYLDLLPPSVKDLGDLAQREANL